jgi:hypothetical protein
MDNDEAKINFLTEVTKKNPYFIASLKEDHVKLLIDELKDLVKRNPNTINSIPLGLRDIELWETAIQANGNYVHQFKSQKEHEQTWSNKDERKRLIKLGYPTYPYIIELITEDI